MPQAGAGTFPASRSVKLQAATLLHSANTAAIVGPDRHRFKPSGS